VILTLAEYTLWSFTKSRCHFDFVELTADPNMDIVKFTIGCCTFSIIRVVEFKLRLKKVYRIIERKQEICIDRYCATSDFEMDSNNVYV
jgi:hypothetical protein